MEIPQRADGRPVYFASYSLAEDGSWLITAETECGQVRVNAPRLIDIERRGYEAIRHRVTRPYGSFDVTFAHKIEIDITEHESLTA